MTSDPSLKALSLPRQALVRRLSRLRYGHVLDLAIVDGEPIPDAATRFVEEVKFGSQPALRSDGGGSDFALRSQVVAMCRIFDEIGDGRVSLLEVRDGLPFRLSREVEADSNGC